MHRCGDKDSSLDSLGHNFVLAIVVSTKQLFRRKYKYNLYYFILLLFSYSSTLSSSSVLALSDGCLDDDEEDEEEQVLDASTWLCGCTPVAEENDPPGAVASMVETCPAPAALVPSGFRNLLFRRVLWGFLSEKAHSSAMRFMR